MSEDIKEFIHNAYDDLLKVKREDLDQVVKRVYTKEACLETPFVSCKNVDEIVQAYKAMVYFTNADTEVEEVLVDGQRATIKIRQMIRLKGVPLVKIPINTIHEVTVEKEGNQWRITKDMGEISCFVGC
jgi:hypothetical protein